MLLTASLEGISHREAGFAGRIGVHRPAARAAGVNLPAAAFLALTGADHVAGAVAVDVLSEADRLRGGDLLPVSAGPLDLCECHLATSSCFCTNATISHRIGFSNTLAIEFCEEMVMV